MLRALLTSQTLGHAALLGQQAQGPPAMSPGAAMGHCTAVWPQPSWRPGP
jgi:hypothetical protein